MVTNRIAAFYPATEHFVTFATNQYTPTIYAYSCTTRSNVDNSTPPRFRKLKRMDTEMNKKIKVEKEEEE